MGTRAVRGAGRWRAWRVGQPVRPSLCRSPGRLRAKLARSAAQRSPRDPPGLARGENCGPRCSITVAPSRWRLPAQAASAKSEAQRGGHDGWPTAWATRGGAACRAAWLGKHLGLLEAPRSWIAPSDRLHCGSGQTCVGYSSAGSYALVGAAAPTTSPHVPQRNLSSSLTRAYLTAPPRSTPGGHRGRPGP